MANKIYKNKQEMLLLTNEAKEIVKQLVTLAKKRGDGMLFKWKHRSEPNSIVHNVELKLKLHNLRSPFIHKVCKGYKIKSEIYIITPMGG